MQECILLYSLTILVQAGWKTSYRMLRLNWWFFQCKCKTVHVTNQVELWNLDIKPLFVKHII